jgi:hypothetical protein
MGVGRTAERVEILNAPRRFAALARRGHGACFAMKDSPDTRAASDFVGGNFDSDYAAFRVKERRLTQPDHLSRYCLLAREHRGNGISGLRQFAQHKVAMPTAVLAMNMERVKCSHIALLFVCCLFDTVLFVTNLWPNDR